MIKSSFDGTNEKRRRKTQKSAHRTHKRFVINKCEPNATSNEITTTTKEIPPTSSKTNK